jgi:hypothetical protein
VADNAQWHDVEAEILAALDVRQVYEQLGVRFTGHPGPRGWQPCHAIDRADEHASAAVNVGPGTARGRYRDLGGAGDSLNLWEFAARYGGYGDWREARKYYAHQVGVKLPGGPEPKRPEDALNLGEPHEGWFALWAEKKGGFDARSVGDAGAVCASYPKTAKPEYAQDVIAFPAYNPPALLDGPACAWVIANRTGGPVQVFRGKGRPPDAHKTISVGGSTGGLLGRSALRRLMELRQAREEGRADGRVEGREGGLVGVVVWKVEGLSDLLALDTHIREAGLAGQHLVISNSQGCLEGVKAEWIELLRGLRVYVVGDADRPGQLGAARWASALAGVADEVRNVQLPYPLAEKHGKDVRDYLAEYSINDLLQIAADTAPVPAPQSTSLFSATDRPRSSGPAAATEPDEDQEGEAVLRLLRLQVLGEYADGGIQVFSEARQKAGRIDHIARFGYAQLVQLCGPTARAHIHNSHEAVPGKRTMDEARLAIAFAAGKRRLDEQPPRGQGCWAAGEDGVVIVNGRRAALWRQGKLRRVTRPRLGRHILEFTAQDGWCSLRQLKRYLELAGDPAWAQETLEEGFDLFGKFSWQRRVDAQVATALVAATYVQTVWSWRPLVGITGPSNSGKTTLYEVLQSLFGGLALVTEKATEAGIRQGVGNRACALLLDEFESDGHRQRVLELLRTSSRGGVITRGTADQRGRTFGLRHITWTAAIELGLVREPDRNRFIVLDLVKPPEERYGQMDLPTEKELAALGHKLMALAVRHVRRADALADALKGHRVEGVPSRIVENYAVPAALLAVAQGQGEGDAAGLLERLLAGRAFAGRVQADDQALVRALLGSLVSLGVDYETRTVSQILTDQNTYEVGRRALEKAGLVRVEETPGRGPRPTNLADCPYLFIGVEEAQRHLLKGTPFANGDIKEILLRLEHRGKKARWVQRKLNGVNVWGCAVPMEAVAPTGVQEGAIVPGEGEPGEGGQRLLWPLQAV